MGAGARVPLGRRFGVAFLGLTYTVGNVSVKCKRVNFAFGEAKLAASRGSREQGGEDALCVLGMHLVYL